MGKKKNLEYAAHRTAWTVMMDSAVCALMPTTFTQVVWEPMMERKFLGSTAVFNDPESYYTQPNAQRAVGTDYSNYISGWSSTEQTNAS